MKNFQMKIILWIYTIGILIISTMGITFSNIIEKGIKNAEYASEIRTGTIIGIVIFSICTIIIAIIEVKKYIEPMSKMLKGARRAAFSTDINNLEINAPEDDLTESVNEIVGELKQNLKDANSEKKQKETILKLLFLMHTLHFLFLFL